MALSVFPRVLGLCVLLLSSGRCGPIPRAVDSVDMQEVLGQFLHMLNLTDPGPGLKPRSSRTKPPEYMLELYNRFATERSATPSANIVRSFRNEDHTSSKSLRTHRLLFNLSVPQQERVVSAELRLHTLLARDSTQHVGSGWKVSVFDTHRGARYDTGERDPLASRHVHREDSGWEVFDMTNAVQHWRKLNIVTPRLEVHVENLNAFRNANVDLYIDKNPDGQHEPVLIVFSDDQNERRMMEEDNELRTDEEQVRLNNGVSRVRRGADAEDCKRAEMYVDFKDIHWDSFVLAPSGYQAFTCRGVCNYPLAREVTPTTHAIIQTLLNFKSPQRASKACCVPTELKPISLLYENENGVVVLNNKYEGMVVKECGCR
ncbi:bone morphogenetic protein 10-like [Pimephales promelas]|uniref:bone morphogenetic protein 10-like n=1 Tax=Pimephales promelas TaxID=90988 RepID=UPI0019558003|nr:bone morphogenetic protein 10-like [Pimephales promelas]KAG1927562.1 bone morphogenetic protein 4 isoform a preproprotein [Pimephales promelas]